MGSLRSASPHLYASLHPVQRSLEPQRPQPVPSLGSHTSCSFRRVPCGATLFSWAGGKSRDRSRYDLRLTPETMAFSGCSITSGLGRGLVTDTGMNTRSPSHSSAASVAGTSAAGVLHRIRGIGRIAKLIAGEEP